MMTFYAAAGSYQIRSEDGKNMPYIMRLAWETNTTVSTMRCHKLVAEPLVRGWESCSQSPFRSSVSGVCSCGMY